MEATGENVLTRAGESVAEAFAAFCEDIGGMFDVTADCTALSSGRGKAADLQKDFKKQISINNVLSKGAMEGSFDLMFDQAGTLILAGIFVMLPEKRILEYVRSGYSGESDFISDAIKEAGNLLVGSWDRIYRAEMKGHKHFLQNGTAVGEPWNSPEEYFCFSPEADCFYSICKITIDPYPAFKCAAVFPMSIFEPVLAQADKPAEPAVQAEPAAEAAPSAETVTEEASVSAPPAEPVGKAEVPAGEPATAEAAEPVVEAEAPAKADEPAASVPDAADAEAPAAKTATEPVAETEDEPAAEKESEPAAEAKPGPVREAIESMVRPAAAGSDLLNGLTAEQVMKPAVLWADPEDTVEQVMKQMQQNESAYVLVGRDQQVEGLVSRSVITGAVSPYLRAMFAHLKRPLDDASLQIRIKWFMSRPVHTVSPQASLETVIHTMFKYGVRGLPVVDPSGSVSGFITVFDVLTALTTGGDSPLLGKPAQTPMLL